jgi:hypothetical protein
MMKQSTLLFSLSGTLQYVLQLGFEVLARLRVTEIHIH